MQVLKRLCEYLMLSSKIMMFTKVGITDTLAQAEYNAVLSMKGHYNVLYQ